MLQSPESVIRTYAPSVCLLHVSVGFLDKNTGQPLRYGGIGPDGPYKDSDGNTVYTLEGRGPEVRSDFFGTGFIVGDNKILTNHHVAQPWWENDELMHATQQGLKPVVATMAAYFPDTPAGFTSKFWKSPRTRTLPCSPETFRNSSALRSSSIPARPEPSAGSRSFRWAMPPG